jgi:ubiquinone/menaquinone biosynthesis C-methylase UbiE
MSTLYDLVRATNDGFAPVFCEPLLRPAFEHLEHGLAAGSVVVDVGCGRGHVTAALHAFGCRSLGFDVDTPSIQSGRRAYPDAQLFAGNAEDLPLPDDSVDALFSFSVFQYVDRSRALAECSRVLKPGGQFVVVENLSGNPIAQLHRARRRLFGPRDDPSSSPSGQHLRWSERSLYEAHFSEVRYEVFYLLTPLFLMSRSMSDPADGGHRVIRRLFRLLQELERTVVRSIPPLRAGCWMLLVYGRK